MAVEYKFPPAPSNHGTMKPAEARAIFRLGNYYGPTAGFCLGYLQANLTVIPSKFADDFEEFCKKNSAPLPLLHRSKPGDVLASPLAEGSNVRSDLPRYLVFSHGRQVSDMRDVLGFDWTDKVSFYIGCSFSFEEALIKNGVELQYVRENKDVSMFLTSIECCDVNNRFTGTRLVVSMRSIRKEWLQKTAVITAAYPMAHGAPVHIGDPGIIGIRDISVQTYGDHTDVNEGEVAVFWACGVTGKQAVESLKADLAFTHYPGHMFITDLKAAPIELSEEEYPVVVCISPPRSPFHASLVSKKRLQLLQQIEKIFLFDPGNCGVSELRKEEDFIKSVLTLSHSQSVGVVFGFPCNQGYECMEETDGPPGALAIAKALQSLGKKVAIISEERNRSIIESSVEAMISMGSLESKLDFRSCQEVLESEGKDFDCLVAIERVGKAADGSHYSFKGVDLSQYLDPIDEIFVKATQDVSMTTIGIGDRGNELGLGRVREKVKEHVPNGEKIGCDVASDYVLLAGVSNWGGYGIAAGLYLLATCPVHWRYLQHGIDAEQVTEQRLDEFLETDQQVEEVLRHLNSLGLRDGVSKSLKQSVDGIPLKTHLEVLQSIRTLTAV